MSETVTPVVTPPTTAAPVTEAPKADAPPAVDPSTAGKALRAARSFEDLKAKGREAAKPAPAAKEEPKTATTPAKAADPDAEAVERILREDRRVKEEAKKLEREKAELAAKSAEVKSAAELKAQVEAARANKDAVGVLRALGYTDDDIFTGDDALIFKLAEAKAKAPAITDKAALEKVVADKLAERDAAEKAETEKKAQEAADAAAQKQAEAKLAIESAKENYSKSVARIAAAAADKYPTLVKLGIPVGVVTEYAWNTGVESQWKTVLTEEQALEQLETHYRERARAALGLDKPAETPPPPPKHVGISINPSWQAQNGRPAAKPPSTLAEKEQALRERARQLAAGK